MAEVGPVVCRRNVDLANRVLRQCTASNVEEPVSGNVLVLGCTCVLLYL